MTNHITAEAVRKGRAKAEREMRRACQKEPWKVTLARSGKTCKIKMERSTCFAGMDTASRTPIVFIVPKFVTVATLSGFKSY